MIRLFELLFASVNVEVIGIHGRDNGNIGMQRKKGTVELIGFCDYNIFFR